jgi:hypothetical protein
MAKTMQEWLRDGSYLPRVLRDFHDQKDVFKCIWKTLLRRRAAKPDERDDLASMTWIQGHIFVIDFFLWFMAQHGYTLQRADKRVFEYFDLGTTLKEMKDEEAAAFRVMLDERQEELKKEQEKSDGV